MVSSAGFPRLTGSLSSDWLNLTSSGYDTAHLEIESIAPKRGELPITGTGYRSHFTSADTVAAHGGPAAFVEAWLECESQTPDWRREEQERRQLALF